MALVKGPFTIKWRDTEGDASKDIEIKDVSEISFEYDVETNDYSTVDGRTYTIDGAITASVELTLLASDVATLGTIFPQYFKAQGETMSTGEPVECEEGAIDIVAASCDTSEDLRDLDIVSCNGQITRLVKAKTSLSSQDFEDNSLRTVTVTFRGQPGSGEAAVQFFKDQCLGPKPVES